jgi:hypothetical protein
MLCARIAGASAAAVRRAAAARCLIVMGDEE